MRALIYYVATSLDGFICHPDGTWHGMAMQGDHVDAFLASLPDFGAVLMGRETYAVGLAQGITSPYPMIAEQLVFSRSMSHSPDPAVELVGEGVIERVNRLKAQPGKPIWLCGGAALAGALGEAGLIDEVWVKQNPVVFGTGRPLFGAGMPTTALRLIETRRFDSGVIQSKYRVVEGR